MHMKSVCLWQSKRMNLKSIAISLSVLMTEASWCWMMERCSWSFVLWSRCQVLLITSQQPHYEPVLASHWSLLTSPGLWLVKTRVLMPPWLTDNVHIFSKKLLLRPEERNNQPHFISHPTFLGSRILLLKVYHLFISFLKVYDFMLDSRLRFSGVSGWMWLSVRVRVILMSLHLAGPGDVSQPFIFHFNVVSDIT